MSTGVDSTVRECKRCYHRWVPRQTTPPHQCPDCHSPYWQTERQPNKRGRPTKVVIIGTDYKPTRHKQWGKWRLNKKPPYSLDFPTGVEIYDIELSRCGTPRSRELWLQQMSGKRYITSADLGDLVRAFIDLIRQGEISIA